MGRHARQCHPACRSGIWIDARGNILYATADAQTAQSLAQILQRAGAVRATELDINSDG